MMEIMCMHKRMEIQRLRDSFLCLLESPYQTFGSDKVMEN